MTSEESSKGLLDMRIEKARLPGNITNPQAIHQA